MVRVDERLWFELAPPVWVAGRPAVGTRIQQLLLDDEPERWTPALLNGLCLAALIYQFARRLIADCGAVAKAPPARRWHGAVKRDWIRVPGASLVWSGTSARDARPSPQTWTFLQDLPGSLVDRALRWAPPVVAPLPRNDGYGVVANHVSAVLARVRRPDEATRVHLFDGRIHGARRISVICAGATRVLEPLFRRYRRRLVDAAADGVEAKLLADYSRAQYFRLKGGARA